MIFFFFLQYLVVESSVTLTNVVAALVQYYFFFIYSFMYLLCSALVMEQIHSTATFSSNRFVAYFAEDSSLFHICPPETEPPPYERPTVIIFFRINSSVGTSVS